MLFQHRRAGRAGTVYGLAQQQPTVNDVWNSTPAWAILCRLRIGRRPDRAHPDRRRPSPAGPRPQPVHLLEPSGHAEIGGYRTLGPRPWTLSASCRGDRAIDGVAPSWRLALEPHGAITPGKSAPLAWPPPGGAAHDRRGNRSFDRCRGRHPVSVPRRPRQFLGAGPLYRRESELSATSARYLGHGHNHFAHFNSRAPILHQTVGSLGVFSICKATGRPRSMAPLRRHNSNTDGLSRGADFIPFTIGGPSWVALAQ